MRESLILAFFFHFPLITAFASLSRFFSGAYCKRDRGASSSFWGKKRAACRRECLLASILILVSVAEKMASGECRMLQRGKNNSTFKRESRKKKRKRNRGGGNRVFHLQKIHAYRSIQIDRYIYRYIYIFIYLCLKV